MFARAHILVGLRPFCESSLGLPYLATNHLTDFLDAARALHRLGRWVLLPLAPFQS